MKNKISTIGLNLAAMAVASPLWAESPAIVSGRSDITFLGNVPPMCSLVSPTMTGDGDLVQNTSTFNTITLAQFTDGNGMAVGLSMQLVYPNATCNFASHLSLLSINGGLRPNGAGNTPGFSTVVNYTATAIWGDGGPQTVLDTSTNALKGNNNNASIPPKSDKLILNIVTKPSTLPLINTGSPYRDTLSIQVGEAL